MRKRGSIEPVVYFVNRSGHVVLAPYSEMATPEGYVREEAGTLDDVDRLQVRLVMQEREQWEKEATHEEALFAPRLAAIRDRLYARMTSGSTPAYEKEFIRLYLDLRIDKRQRHRERFSHREAYLWARENDSPGRAVDHEEFNPERHTVKS